MGRLISERGKEGREWNPKVLAVRRSGRKKIEGSWERVRTEKNQKSAVSSVCNESDRGVAGRIV